MPVEAEICRLGGECSRRGRGDWTAARSSGAVGHCHLLPAAARLTSLFLQQIFIDHLSCGGHSTRHSEGHPGIRYLPLLARGF